MKRIFKPNFKYTDKIVKNLVEIASAREAVLNSYLMPKWEISLRKDALVRATHASTAIEGNPLTIEEVSLLAHGRKVLTERHMKIIENLQKNGKITSGEVARMFGVTRQAALKELYKLVEPEIIRLEGKGRGAYYVMA